MAKRIYSRSFFVILLCALGPASCPQMWAQTADTVSQAMKDEMARSMSLLRLEQMNKPYFIAYRVQDVSEQKISATLGSLTSASALEERGRIFGVELRVGDYTVDNTNFLPLQRLRSGGAGLVSGISQGTVDDDYAQVRRQLWLETDGQYKRALEDYSAKQAVLKQRSAGESIPDFSKESVVVLETAKPTTARDSAALEQLARDLSAEFLQAKQLQRSSVEIDYRDIYTRFLNSEGTSFTRFDPMIKLVVTAQAQAKDGEDISDSFTVYARSAAEFPKKEELAARVRTLATGVEKLRDASSLDSYNGPVLFENAAAGEVFLQHFGSQLATSRMPISDNPQVELFLKQMLDRLGSSSLQDKVGARILPAFISVQNDPQPAAANSAPLLGSLPIDDDGVKTRQMTLVEHGVLKSVAASRVPVRGFLHSSGGRRGWGAVPNNLMVLSEKTLPQEQLKKELLRLAKERGLDYAIIVRRVGAGSEGSFFELAKQMEAQGSASSSIPEVYKLYSDGHEEPLRGVHISGLGADAFKNIVATGDRPVVYNDQVIPGIISLFSVGLSSGADLPLVSCVIPSLLFEEVSLAKSEGPFPSPAAMPSPLMEK